MKRWWMTLLAAVLCLLTACGGQSVQGSVSSVPETPASSVRTETPAEPEQPVEPEAPAEPEVPEKTGLTPAEQAILAERRETAENYMRAMATVIWRAEEDIVYTIESGKTPEESAESSRLYIKAGRLYRGMPYSYGYSTLETFLSFTEKPEGSLVYTVSGLEWQALSRGSGGSNLGNDCSGALVAAWSQIGATTPMNSTKSMCEKYGFLKVGEYESDPNENANTHIVTMEKNGEQVMYRAYAQLQKADGIVRRKGSSGHARMIVSVSVAYNADGTIDGEKSTVTFLDQTRSYLRSEKKHYNSVLGEYVYEIYGVDKRVTFKTLCQDGYLPITCKELIDPSPVAEPEVTDSVTEHDRSTILSGKISSNWVIDTVTVIINDSAGNEVQKAALNAHRTSPWSFDMQKFLKEAPEVMQGSMDLQALTPGAYRCTTVCRLCTGQEITVREFDFAV